MSLQEVDVIEGQNGYKVLMVDVIVELNLGLGINVEKGLKKGFLNFFL